MQRLSSDRLEVASQRLRLPSPDDVSAGGANSGIQTAADATAATLAAEAARLKTAFDSALERGRTAGLADAESEIERRVTAAKAQWQGEHDAAIARLKKAEAAFLALARSLPAAVTRLAEDAEESAVEIGFAATTRLLGDKVADRTLLRDLCRVIVAEHGAPDAVLRVSEADAAELAGQDLGVAVEGDRRLSAGQCAIDTPRGRFDSGLDVRLESLKHAFLAGFAVHRREP